MSMAEKCIWKISEIYWNKNLIYYKIAEVNREIRIERFSEMVPYLLLFEFCWFWLVTKAMTN